MTRAFCVGQAKSGTASLHSLVATRYRSAHEPERPALLDMIVRAGAGEVSDPALRRWLVERDKRLGLEFDIGWPNQFVARHLAAVFPQARFVALVRDPYDWLESLVGHLISRDVPKEIPRFLQWWFAPAYHPHTRHDRALRDHGLYSVAAYLNGWRRHVEIVRDEVPPDRRLVLRTEDLDASPAVLARFLGIPTASLDTAGGRRNVSTWSGTLADVVDRGYVEDAIAALCDVDTEGLFEVPAP